MNTLLIIALLSLCVFGRPDKKAYLHPRAVECNPSNYADEYGACFCEEDLWNRQICKYWEWCDEKKPDPNRPCFRRQLNHNWPELGIPNDEKCYGKGVNYVDFEGYCACEDTNMGCKFFKYTDMDIICSRSTNLRLNHGMCMPDERGKMMWFVFEDDKTSDHRFDKVLKKPQEYTNRKLFTIAAPASQSPLIHQLLREGGF